MQHMDRKKTQRIALGLFVALSLAALGVVQAGRTPATPGEQPMRVIFQFPDQISPSTLRGKSALHSRKAIRAQAPGHVQQLKALAANRQAGLVTQLGRMHGAGGVETFRSLWLVNAVAVNATPSAIQQLQQLFPGATVLPDPPVILTATATQTVATSTPLPDWNATTVRAREAWALGYRGQGVVIASLDTGIDPLHPDFATSNFYGGSDGWCDTVNAYQHPLTPCTGPAYPGIGGDLNGHGTAVSGVLVGSPSPTAPLHSLPVGIAPDAQWITVRAFKPDGSANLSDTIAGMQWLLSRPVQPDIINMSWTVFAANGGSDGCMAADAAPLRQMIETLYGLGIFLVAASGNNGYAELPAAFKEVFAVGAVNSLNYLWAGSGAWGASGVVCPGRTQFGDQGGQPYPNIVAPGEGVIAPDLTSGGHVTLYQSATGTSIAAPHASAAAAILLSAWPDATLDELARALEYGAVAAGGQTTVDGYHGYGRLDIMGALQQLQPLAVRPGQPIMAHGEETANGDVVLHWLAPSGPATGNGGALQYKVSRDGVEIAGPATGPLFATTLTDTTPGSFPTYEVIAADAATGALQGAAAVVLPGNVNTDSGVTRHRVDAFDMVRLLGAMGATPADPAWNPALDLVADGVVDQLDLDFLMLRIGHTEFAQ
ncbi:MAG: S8 family serine peptidase [Nitrospirota bacterium]|nr:S8 family serine peptidase [Nitrospirota bacterium]